MAKINSKNNDLLNLAKERINHKIYPIILKLVNDNREDLAEIIIKIDYLLEYTSTCIKQKDYKEAKSSIKLVEDRMEILKRNGVEIGYIEYLYDGIKKKVEKKK